MASSLGEMVSGNCLWLWLYKLYYRHTLYRATAPPAVTTDRLQQFLPGWSDLITLLIRVIVIIFIDIALCSKCSKINFKFLPQQQNPHPYFLLCLIISVPGNQNEILLNLIEPLTWLPRFIHRAHFLFCFGITNAMSPFKESDVG